MNFKEMMYIKIWKTTGMVKVPNKIINASPWTFSHPSTQEDVLNTCCVPGTKLGAGDSQAEMTERLFSTHSSLRRIRWLASSFSSFRKSLHISNPWLLSSIKWAMAWELGVNQMQTITGRMDEQQDPPVGHRELYSIAYIESEKQRAYMDNGSTLLYSRNQDNIVSQLPSVKNK